MSAPLKAPLSARFDNSYARFGDGFFSRTDPTPVADPAFLAINHDLGRELGLDMGASDALQVFSGNAIAAGSEPIAQAYAGHQFGNFVPQLGDGRAVLLGEIIDTAGLRRDVQLKGAGRTPFSRNGDGRAWLGPVLREYLVSEAMHALHIPTTRALAAVSTGERVQRETALPGAVLTRVASSHIRVGTFQYFAARRDLNGLKTLTNYTIARHYPDADGALELLNCVVARQAELVAKWLGVGFIHGVMNTDNCHIAGETIDYGPCAFIDQYHPATVYSAIDRQGRYAYQNQPDIAVWNLAQLATALLPLIAKNQDTAIEQASEVIDGFGAIFAARWLAVFRAKIGLSEAQDGDAALISDLLKRMSEQDADFTNTFRALARGTARAQFKDPYAFDDWADAWQARRNREQSDTAEQNALMTSSNPAFIARNHRVEQMIDAAINGDMAPFERLSRALSTPFEPQPDLGDLSQAPEADEEVQQTFCGT